MATATFRQADSRWGSKNYNGSSTMAAAGCGPTACADLIYNIDTSITPWTTAQWMKSHGYAIRNAGTAWAGIPACLKAFGMTEVKEQATMSAAFAAMQKGHMAVILFRGGTKGGVTWTTAGHYVAASQIKIENGKHYLYTHDPGGRHHDGWYAYETTMKGLIPAIWTCTFSGQPAPVPTPTPTSEKITVDGSWGKATTKLTQKVLKCTIDGVLGKQTWKAIQKKVGTTQDGIPGPNTYKAMSKFLGITIQKSKTTKLVKAWQKWLNTQIK